MTGNQHKFDKNFGDIPLKDQREISNYLKTLSVQDLAAMLRFVPEEDRWDLMRDLLLSIRTEVATQGNESPLGRAIDYLYILLRFVEISKRFPTKKEQGELFQEVYGLSGRNALMTDAIAILLRKAADSPRSRKAARQLKEIERFYRDEGQELPDAPKRYEGGADEEW